MNSHESFFSFSVPPRNSPPGGHREPSGAGYDVGQAQNGGSSVSPDSTHPSVNQRGSLGSSNDPFAFSVPPTTAGGGASPDSSHGYGSRPGTAATAKPHSDGAPDHRLPPPWGSGISTHNTRPMTAPGAGWGSGSLNHGYDYSTASAGLFGDGSSSSFARPAPAVVSEAPAAHTPTSSAWPPQSQTLERPLGTTAAGGPEATTSGYDAYRGRNFSLPDLGSGNQLSSGLSPPYGTGPAGGAVTTSAGASYLRPSTHAGTSMQFGALEAAARPATAYSTYTTGAPGYGGASRPGTGMSAASAYEAHPSAAMGAAVYATHGMMPSVLAPPGIPPPPFAMGYGMGDGFLGADKYPFLPGQPRKRARRRYDEIERLYECNYPGCTKGYGTLNHLNAHITMQKHGPKRLPQEFKEIRKEWRAKKKAEAEARSAAAKQMGLVVGSGVDVRPPTATILPPSLPGSRPVTSHHPPPTAMSGYSIGHPPSLSAAYYAPRPPTAPHTVGAVGMGGGGLGMPVASYGASAGYGGDFSYHRPTSSAGPGIAHPGAGWAASSQAVDA